MAIPEEFKNKVRREVARADSGARELIKEIPPRTYQPNPETETKYVRRERNYNALAKRRCSGCGIGHENNTYTKNCSACGQRRKYRERANAERARKASTVD